MGELEELDSLHRKVHQVFSYLKAFDEHRNPVTRQLADQRGLLRLRNLPNHPAIQFNYPLPNDVEEEVPAVRSDASDSTSSDEDLIGNTLLEVRRPRLSRPPAPPEDYADWVEDGWEDPFEEAKLISSKQRLDPDGNEIEETLEESVERLEALNRWRALRDDWAQDERPAREAMEIYQRLFELKGHLEREGEQIELVVGDGLLNWRLPEGGIHHPVLLQSVEFEFDSDIPAFYIRDSDAPPELYSALFHTVEELEGTTIRQIRNELDEQGLHPFQGDPATAFLRGVATRLSSKGEFVATGSIQGARDYPRLAREPVLFVRKRTLGFATALEAILDSTPEREDFPEPLGRVVGVEQEARDATDELPPSSGEPPEEILLSREANAEQMRAAQRLEHSSSIVVQGPPGTGKTHTIANLVGHCLAKGNTVLVTSHTAKALAVLRDQVVVPLRPLCLSVLGPDVESRRQLENAVESIVEHLSGSDPAVLEREARRLAKKRSKLLEEREQIRKQLLDAISGEFRQIVVSGEGFEPSEAARQVAAGSAEDSWVPGPIEAGADLPLSLEELDALYASNEHLSVDEERELDANLPRPSMLVEPRAIRALADEKAQAENRDSFHGRELWDRAPESSELEALSDLLELVRQQSSQIEQSKGWQLFLLDCGAKDPRYRAPWIELLEEIRDFEVQAAKTRELGYRFGPEIPTDLDLREQEAILADITQRLGDAERVSTFQLLLHPKWRNLVKRTVVEHGQPSTQEHFQALLQTVRFQRRRERLVHRWQRQAEPIGLPSIERLGDALDTKLAETAQSMHSALDFHGEKWLPLQESLVESGLNWERIRSELPRIPDSSTPEADRIDRALEELEKILTARRNAARSVYLEEQHRELGEQLAELRTKTDASNLASRLIESMDALDVEAYDEALQELRQLEDLRSILDDRRAKLAKLEPFAPEWARKIALRAGAHGESCVPGNARRAWLWRQLFQELESRSSASMDELQQRMDTRRDRLRRVTAELIEKRAWAAQIRRTTLDNRQALMGWKDILRKTPKSSSVPGKLARLRREAREAMKRCRDAVPVWIMPLNRVVETFDFQSTHFDVAIVDEASQTDVMGLVVYYLADKVLVVGDHEQVSPSAVGQKDQVVRHLIDEHLQDIPNAILYDGKTSIYDLARQSSGGVTCLLEHFRCVPEIIQFSNDLAYDGKIRPLRDSSSVELKPSLVPYRVDPVESPSKTNIREAEAIASLIVACTERAEYADKTIGAVTMVGSLQALEIERLLLEHLPEDAYVRHQIVCGNPAQFQGDERDVVFLSLVDMPRDGPLPLRTQPLFRQRFNVAASRAKDQLWVVHSVDPERDLKPSDLRRRLIEHALDPQALVRKLDRAEQRAESEFERRVAQRLIREGYRIRQQWQVGYYRIDIVVEGREKRLAVECDGDRWHPIDKLQEDLQRQATLERLGWRFIRIRGSQFFRDPDAAMRPVFERLERTGIEPEAVEPNDMTHEPETNHLLDELKRRAQELRRLWKEDSELDVADYREYDRQAEAPTREHRSQSRPEQSLATRTTDQIRKQDSNESADDEQRTKFNIESATSARRAQEKKANSSEPSASSPNKKRQSERPTDYSEEEESRDRLYLATLSADVLLELSHWAKENELLQGWQRKLLYSVGRYKKRGWQPSVKQTRRAVEAYREAVRAGFKPEGSRQRALFNEALDDRLENLPAASWDIVGIVLTEAATAFGVSAGSVVRGDGDATVERARLLCVHALDLASTLTTTQMASIFGFTEPTDLGEALREARRLQVGDDEFGGALKTVLSKLN